MNYFTLFIYFVIGVTSYGWSQMPGQPDRQLFTITCAIASVGFIATLALILTRQK